MWAKEITKVVSTRPGPPKNFSFWPETCGTVAPADHLIEPPLMIAIRFNLIANEKKQR